MELLSGKVYLISHERKGTFMMRVDSQDGTWANGVIVGGSASAILDYNEKFLGDDISVRISLLRSAVEQPGEKKQ